MATLLARRKWVLAKIEGTYGTDPTHAAGDAVLTSNLAIARYEGNRITRDFDRSTLGGDTVINTAPFVQVTFDVEIAGSAAAGTAPPYDPLLRACGLLATNGASDHTFTPRDSGFESVAFEFYHEGNAQLVLGCRGTVQFVFERGQIPKYRFTFTGRYTKPATATEITPDTSAYRTPVPMTNANTTTFSLLGYSAYQLEALTIDLGNSVIHRNVVGADDVLITNRQMSFSATTAAIDISDNDIFADMESHSGITTGALQLVHATTPDRVTFDSDSVQVTALTEGESDGLGTYQLSGVMTPDGSDEFTLTVD